MAQTIAFRKIRFTNPFGRIGRRFKREAEDLPKREAKFIRVQARSSMRKAPKKPKSRFGTLQAYGRRSKKYGKYFWRKGLYSRPGHPPFHHGQQFNLRTILYLPINSPDIAHSKGGRVTAYRVGPKKSASSKRTPGGVNPPVPMLHEYGGQVRISKGASTFEDRGIRLRRSTGNGLLNYPERPYMRPAAKIARETARKKSPNSLKKLVRLGGLTGTRIY